MSLVGTRPPTVDEWDTAYIEYEQMVEQLRKLKKK